MVAAARPLTDHFSVGVAACALFALAAASFSSGLVRQLNAPRPERGEPVTATVVIMPPRPETAIAIGALAVTDPPVNAAPAKRVRHRAAPTISQPAPAANPSAVAASDSAVDAAGVSPGPAPTATPSAPSGSSAFAPAPAPPT